MSRSLVSAFIILQVMVTTWSASALAEGKRTRLSLTLDHGYRYQGIDQTYGGVSWRASLHHHLSDEISAGIWVGQYELPNGFIKSTEVDFFIAYSKQLTFTDQIDVSLWRYTYSDDYLQDREWTQVLSSYHRDERFTFTFGLADNVLRTDGISSLLEGTYRYPTGFFTTSVSLGRNFLQDPQESFSYAQLNLDYTRGPWRAFVSYTAVTDLSIPATALYVSEGAGLGLSYNF